MSAATFIPSFHQLDARHTYWTQRFIDEDLKRHPDHSWEILEGKNDCGVDAFVTINGERFAIEFKSLAGANASGQAYPTLCVEMFCDYEQTKRTDWRDHADFVVFLNIHQEAAYIYDAIQLDNWASLQKLRPSGTGTGQYGKKDKLCSWVVCSRWENENAGHVQTYLGI
jgi:hypothetical protein